MTSPASYNSVISAETDEGLVIKWVEVNTVDLLKYYYRQRLGPSFNDADVPTIRIARSYFYDMLKAPDSPLADLIETYPELLKGLFFAFGRASANDVIVAMDLENPQCGEPTIEFLRVHESDPAYRELRENLQILAERVQHLRLLWERDKPLLGEYDCHKLLIPLKVLEQLKKVRTQLREADLEPEEDSEGTDEAGESLE